MSIKLMDLPYATNALEPVISAATLEVHHGKHHKAYVDKVNELVGGTPLDGQPLEAIIAAAAEQGNAGLFNQSGQVWNHGFYWNSLSPEEVAPEGVLAEAMTKAFGSAESCLDQMIDRGVKHFASGWVWLVAQGQDLAIQDTHDAGLPLDPRTRPLLVLDVWEHAYYLDRKNDRKAYLQAATGRLNWRFAADNLAREDRWRYPG